MTVTVTIIVIVVVVLLVLAAIGGYLYQGRRLRRRFGPEYDRMLESKGSRFKAEQELRGREKRHDSLTLHDLTPEARDRYAEEWRRIQAQFVDDPGAAATQADALITRIMTDRGYPTGQFDQRADDLSVEHATTVDRYRRAHELTISHHQGTADTEDLRHALVDYRALVTDLLGTNPVPTNNTTTTGDTTPADTTAPAEPGTLSDPADPTAARDTDVAGTPAARDDDLTRTGTAPDEFAGTGTAPDDELAGTAREDELAGSDRARDHELAGPGTARDDEFAGTTAAGEPVEPGTTAASDTAASDTAVPEDTDVTGETVGTSETGAAAEPVRKSRKTTPRRHQEAR